MNDNRNMTKRYMTKEVQYDNYKKIRAYKI